MRHILFAAIVAVGLNYSTLLTPSPTPPVKERLKLLKWQLQEKIEEKQRAFSIVPPDDDVDILDANLKDALRAAYSRITPISRLKRKKLRTTGRPRTTAETTTDSQSRDMLRDAVDNATDVSSDISKENLERQLERKQLQVKAKKWAKHLKKYGTPLEIFYRRDSKPPVNEAEIRQRHLLHCADLLRPILTGMKKNVTQQKVYGEPIVNRLIQLLSYGGTGQTADEIRAILLQINNLQIRFFQWDVYAIKKLFNFIMPGQKHSFKSLKYGVKKILLSVWKMDLSNTHQLINESRMFRPPCVGSSKGSTMSSKATRYTVPDKPKSTCAPKDKKCLKYAEDEEEDGNVS